VTIKRTATAFTREGGTEVPGAGVVADVDQKGRIGVYQPHIESRGGAGWGLGGMLYEDVQGAMPVQLERERKDN
jgi:hypothetical protein